MLYEASARVNDPIYGCTAEVYKLQKEIAELKSQLVAIHAELNYHFIMDGHSLWGWSCLFGVSVEARAASVGFGIYRDDYSLCFPWSFWCADRYVRRPNPLLEVALPSMPICLTQPLWGLDMSCIFCSSLADLVSRLELPIV
ncbi:hypothetical protein SUGI_0678420 [Cryptomeria japonica]|nr:hypothetical protein SUGI_0678420 [Cryptomeria japonica]